MKIYMIGIGGIGMSALAQLYLARGDEVSGSDREHSPATELLEKKGIHINYGQAVAKMPADTDIVVYSDAIPESHIERGQARELRKQQQSYFQALGRVSAGRTTIAVSGTNGKTTTTAMLAKILVDTGKNPSAVIGSLVKDFSGNYVEGNNELFVVEACEYRDHLLEIDPKVLVITNVIWDHTDWFKTEAQMFETFRKAILKVPADGVIVANLTYPYMDDLLKGAQARIVDYSKEQVPELQLIGEFNKDNARAAIAGAKALFPDIDNTLIYGSVKSFQGTWRRFEYKGKTANGAEVYDDYAHHPSAIAATLAGARERFPGKKIVIAFHPHLYSRTRDLFNDFVMELAKADSILLAPIYAARETDEGDVSSDKLAEAIRTINPNVESLPDFESIGSKLKAQSSDTLIVTMGAGDIYKVADEIVI